MQPEKPASNFETAPLGFMQLRYIEMFQAILQAGTLTLPDGAAVEFPIEAFARYCLLNGVDELGFLLQQAAAIKRYEQTHA